jgi:hypothetical protein
MKTLLAALLISLSFACGQTSDETDPMADDMTAAQLDPMAQLSLAEKAAAPYVKHPEIARIDGDYVKSSKAYAWTYEFAGDGGFWATIKIAGNGKVTVLDRHQQIDIIPGVGFFKASDLKVSFSALLKDCAKKGFSTLPLQVTLVRPRMDPLAILKDAEWYAEYGSKGEVRVDAVTGQFK